MRCDICGRLPAEECCDTCHRVHRAYWQDQLDNAVEGRTTGLALRVLAGLDEAINTEAVNQ